MGRDFHKPAVHCTPSHAYQNTPNLIDQPKLRVNFVILGNFGGPFSTPVREPTATKRSNDHCNPHGEKAGTHGSRWPVIPDGQFGGELHGHGKVCRVEHGGVKCHNADGWIAEEAPVSLKCWHGWWRAAFRGRSQRGRELRAPEEEAAALVYFAVANTGTEGLRKGK